jgi:hypothetical protein
VALELYFSNTNLSITNFLFYNPDFTSLSDPYQQIDYLYYGLRRTPLYSSRKGDFCLILYKTNIISNSWIKRFPTCHTIIIPETIHDYPYTILQAFARATDPSAPATMQTFYHQF